MLTCGTAVLKYHLINSHSYASTKYRYRWQQQGWNGIITTKKTQIRAAVQKTRIIAFPHLMCVTK
jgi:hypothetical protein